MELKLVDRHKPKTVLMRCRERIWQAKGGLNGF